MQVFLPWCPVCHYFTVYLCCFFLLCLCVFKQIKIDWLIDWLKWRQHKRLCLLTYSLTHSQLRVTGCGSYSALHWNSDENRNNLMIMKTSQQLTLLTTTQIYSCLLLLNCLSSRNLNTVYYMKCIHLIYRNRANFLPFAVRKYSEHQ